MAKAGKTREKADRRPVETGIAEVRRPETLMKGF
jgi:hypothetical protein